MRRCKVLEKPAKTINTIDCKTVHIFAYSSTREQSNRMSGTRLKTERETGERGSRASLVRLLRHALPISFLILRKKPTVLQSTNTTKIAKITQLVRGHLPKLRWLNEVSLDISRYIVHVNIFIIRRYAANKLLKKKERGQAKKNAHKLSVEIKKIYCLPKLSRYILLISIGVSQTLAYLINY